VCHTGLQPTQNTVQVTDMPTQTKGVLQLWKTITVPSEEHISAMATDPADFCYETNIG